MRDSFSDITSYFFFFIKYKLIHMFPKYLTKRLTLWTHRWKFRLVTLHHSFPFLCLLFKYCAILFINFIQVFGTNPLYRSFKPICISKMRYLLVRFIFVNLIYPTSTPFFKTTHVHTHTQTKTNSKTPFFFPILFITHLSDTSRIEVY
jgi:hypothetical protein